MTEDLISFLRARINEDERDARAATSLVAADLTGIQEPTWWEKVEHGRVYAGDWHMVVQASANHASVMNTGVLPHIARHDPARALREAVAKRQMLDLHVLAEQDDGDGFVTLRCMVCDPQGSEPYYPCQTLRLLAAVYADHPDYRQEWRP